MNVIVLQNHKKYCIDNDDAAVRGDAIHIINQ